MMLSNLARSQRVKTKQEERSPTVTTLNYLLQRNRLTLWEMLTQIAGLGIVIIVLINVNSI